MSDLCCQPLKDAVKLGYIASFGAVQRQWVARFAEQGEDGGSDELLIKYCPFCGERL